MRLLAVQDRSEQELRRRLSAADTPPAVVDDTIKRLHELSYLDDGRYAATVAERAVRRGFGSERVRATLAAKGVAEAVSDAAVRAAFADEATLARAVLTRRFGGPPPQPSERARAARYLLRRGFPADTVLAIVGEGC